MTVTVHDTMGRVWKTGLPDGTWTTNEYHPTGLLRKTSGSRTYPVEYAYDHAGRMRTMTTWQSHASGTGAAVTTWNYHATRGWLAGKRYADNLGPDYAYTSGGRLASRTWARGIVTTNTYNTAGDLWTVNYSDGVTAGVTNTYDRRGRATATAGGGTTTTRSYHDAGLLLSEAYAGGPLNGQAVRWNYDPLLRRSALLVSNATAGVLHRVSYGYDAASRLKAVTNGLSSAAYAYLANGAQVAQVAFTHSGQPVMTTTRSFDFLDRLTAVTNLPAAAAQSFRFAYNTANQRTAITNADNSKWVYEYDALGQVVSGKKQWSDGTPVAAQQFEYAFDDIGNRKWAKEGGDANGANLRESTYGANALNQYTNRTVPGYVPLYGTAATNATVTIWGSAGVAPASPSTPGATARKGEYFWKEFTVDNASAPAWASFTNIGVLKNAGTNGLDIVATNTGSVLVAPASVTFTNDADGNLLTDGLWDYTWDGENRLVKIESRTNVPAAARRKVELAYDAQSRLVRLRESAWNSGTLNYQLTNTLNFISDGWQCAVELDGTNNAYRRGYTWGLDLSGTTTGAGGVGGLLLLNSATNGAHCYAYDANGNVAGLVGASGGQWTAEYEYSPFGQTLRATGPMARENPYRFSTKRTESASGLVLYEYRPYHADLGRWPNRDPIGEEGGINLYQFVGNEPANGIDPLGLYLRSPSWINCLGYASGQDADIQPDPSGGKKGKGESLKDVAEKLGYKCSGPTTKECKAKCDQDVMVVYIYDYRDNPDKKNPWKDPWIQSPGNDFHAIRGQCGQWSYVPGLLLKGDKRIGPWPTSDPTNPDSYWKGNVPKQRYCCIKKK